MERTKAVFSSVRASSCWLQSDRSTRTFQENERGDQQAARKAVYHRIRGRGVMRLDHRPEIDRGRVHQAEAVEGLMRVSHEMWTSLPVLMEAIATSLETSQ
ncbi:hypothetical protein PUR32_20320, partial [Streptomyces sp. BE133]|nr:hypothetical protein [Streptomyces sp. BE133]